MEMFNSVMIAKIKTFFKNLSNCTSVAKLMILKNTISQNTSILLSICKLAASFDYIQSSSGQY